MKKWLLIISSTIFVFALIGFLPSCSSTNINDLEKMHESYKNFLLEDTNTKKTEVKTIEDIKNELEEQTIQGEKTYYLKNVDYNNDISRSNYPAGSHVSKTLDYIITATKTNNNQLKDIAIGMTYYWIYNNYKNTNWWQNDLGVRNNLASVALFILDDLSDKGKAALLGKVKDATFTGRPEFKTHTGANLIDYADISLKYSLLTKNTEAFDECFKRVADEIVVDEGNEGFRSDGSFFQHHKQVQNASYGKCVLRLGKFLKIISAANKTFSTEKMSIISNYILRGLRGNIQKGYINYQAISREYSREKSLDVSSNNYSQFKYYLDVQNFPNKQELEKFINDLKDKQSTFEGILYFDQAKMITANIDGLYMSYKGSDDTLTNTECVNCENQLGLNLSYGTNTSVMDKGNEYFNISPLWKYDYVPGTTSFSFDEGKEDQQLLDITQKSEYYSDSLYEKQLPKDNGQKRYIYSGGEDKNNNVACLMEKSTSHEENDFTVTCFMCEDGMVMVGSDLSYNGTITGPGKYFTKDRQLHTTLEQCNYNGSHSLDSNEKRLVIGNAVYKIIDNKNKINVSIENTSGMWQRNNPELTKPTEPSSGQVITAWIDYSSNQKQNYAYTVQPLSRQDKSIELIQTNNSNIHAIKLSNGKVLTAFYEDGKFEYEGNTYEGKAGEFKVF